MKVRKAGPIYADGNRADCEVEHPIYGWVPHTAARNDVVPLCAAIFDAIEARPGVEEFEFETPDEAAERERLAQEIEGGNQ